MTIREVHIEINQSLQKVASNTTRKFLSEEIDWVVNKMQSRFLQMKLQPFERGKVPKNSVDQLTTDSLRNLIVSGKTIQAYKDTTKRVKCILPSDYMYLLSDASLAINNCRVTSTEGSSSIVVNELKATPSPLSSNPYYTDSTLTIGSTVISIPSGLVNSNSYGGYIKKEDISELVAYYLHKARQAGIEIYWERYDDLYKPQTFIIIGSYAPISLVHDSTTVTDLNTYTLTKTQYNEVVATHYTVNRLEATENIPNLLTTSFYTTSLQSPISELVGTNLYVYHDDNFKVRKCEVSYIRKPQRVSLSLGVDCEIAEEFHQTICDLAVEYLKGRMEDAQGKQLITQDNETRIIL